MNGDILPYLDLAVRRKASDIFFTVGAPVSLSIDGQVRPIGHDVLDSQTCRNIIYSILSDDQIREYEGTYELNMAITFANVGRFRVNVYRQRGESAMVLRHIKEKVPSVEELGLPEVLQTLVMNESGLILIVGATSSGKSTTLATMIDYRNTNHRGHIISVENPIEFLHSHKKSLVDQREVGLDTKSYSIALENVLREAPDVIVIGEVRDEEAMKHALHYSETGHVCLTTLHASNAVQALERIVNFFPDSSRKNVLGDLAEHLRGIVAQRLIPGKAGGRYPAVEVLLNTPYMADLIAQDRLGEIRDAMERDKFEGIQTFDECLYSMVKDDKITIEEALTHADSKNNLSLRLRLEHGTTTDFDPSLKVDDSL